MLILPPVPVPKIKGIDPDLLKVINSKLWVIQLSNTWRTLSSVERVWVVCLVIVFGFVLFSFSKLNPSYWTLFNRFELFLIGLHFLSVS